MGRGDVISQSCYRHPTRLAVEQCEDCRRPVCGACLWYGEGGKRLCPDHAADALHAGQEVAPPERYAEGILHAQMSAARPAAGELPYKGNSTDVTALVAAISGVSALAACVGLSWVIPFVAFALGLVGVLQARDSADPGRTRLLAGLGLASGGIFVLMVLGFVLLVMLCALTISLTNFSTGP